MGIPDFGTNVLPVNGKPIGAVWPFANGTHGANGGKDRRILSKPYGKHGLVERILESTVFQVDVPRRRGE